MIVIYHLDDLDGQSSAAIIYNKFQNVKLIGVNYTSNIDVANFGDEVVYIVDFILPIHQMLELKQKIGNKLFWIDHHQTSIDISIENGFSDINGIRKVNIAACELTWKFLYGSNIPYFIYLLGRYDVWDHSKDKNIIPFQFGIKSYDTSPNKLIWKKLLKNNTSLLKNIIHDGIIIKRYYDEESKRISEKSSFEITFEGYNTICINQSNVESHFLNSVIDKEKHDIVLIFSYTPQYVWKISIYSTRNDINVGLIAKKYGGGGHLNAAGFNLLNINNVIK